MRIYENKKDEIIEKSKKLFYEKGYNATSFDLIAKECNIAKSLITYHFNSKYELARTVLNKYISEVKNTIALKTYIASDLRDVQIATAVEMYVLEVMYKEDEKTNRFYMELPVEIYSPQYTKIDKNRYVQHDRQVRLDIDRDADEISMIAVSSHAAVHALHCAYYNNLFDCTFEQYLKYMIKLPYVLMNVDKERMKIILNETYVMVGKMQYKILPEFKIE